MGIRKTTTTRERLYRVQFLNQGKVYEIYARRVGPSDIFGFVAIEGLVFGEKSLVVIDPSEERLKNEFDGVPLTHVPLHAVIRIDEVKKQGSAKIIAIDGNSDNVVGLPFAPGSAPRKN